MQSYRKANKDRDRILFIAVILAVTATVCILCLSYGKIQADILKKNQADGTTASAYLENGTEMLANQIGKLPYVKQVGLQNSAGKLMNDSQAFCSCTMLDPISYEKMIKPALADIHGDYPQTVDEIMLSTKTMTYLGIDNPQIGMNISLDFYWNNIFKTNLTGEQEFVLSGYFTDLRNDLSETSVAYISKARLELGNIPFYPSRILIDTDKAYMEAAQVEKLLYRDVVLSEKQQFVCTDSAFYRTFEDAFGGFGTACVFSLLIFLSLFLFVYNILHISMSNNIRQYGLLEVLGVTKRFIKIMTLVQILQIWFAGSLAGGFLSGVIVGSLYPKLIGALYLDGRLEKVSVFAWFFLIIAWLFILVTLLLATAFSMRILIKLSPNEALKYEGIANEVIKKSKKHESLFLKNHPVVQIAWGNVLRSKKSFLMTVFSLVLGCNIALAAITLVRGTDLIHKLSQTPDFTIELTQNASRLLIETSQDIRHMELFSNSMITEIAQQAQIDSENISYITGFIPILDSEGQDSIRMLNNSEDPITIIQRIEDTNLKELEQYIQENRLNIDMSTFLNGNGTIILHKHLLSKILEESAIENIEKQIGVYDLVPVGTKMSASPSTKLTNCGYIDFTAKKTPDLPLCWNGDNTICLIVSGQTFSQLADQLTKQVFRINFDVKKEIEPEVKNKLKQWIRIKNMEFQSTGYPQNINLLSMECNTDHIAKERNYIETTRIIMFAISSILIFMGIINYFNTIVTDMIMRKKEFAVMECLGMSRKQLKHMLMIEGGCYFLIVFSLLVTIGTAMLLILNMYMKSKLSYFTFSYPYDILMYMLMLLLLICVVVPKLVYRQCNKESIVESMKKSNE